MTVVGLVFNRKNSANGKNSTEFNRCMGGAIVMEIESTSEAVTWRGLLQR